MALDFPSELNPARLNGLYLTAECTDAGSVDIDSDGRNERVHYRECCIKYTFIIKFNNNSLTDILVNILIFLILLKSLLFLS
ncbi:MAG: hypothetical protein B1H13_05760 [Desulfobacteraceae bacterium 4484_190.3]|nr:MAG: hypothetical protein B1H13_05760 [Desulfobacteraceae bacterium 4484_190.3]